MDKLLITLTVMTLSIAAQADWWYEASADGKSDKIVSTGGWTIPCTRDTKTGAITTGKSTAGSETDVDLRNVTGLPDGAKITALGYQTFRSKVAITSVLLPDTITTFANEVFTGCSSLTNVWPFLPPSVTTLGRMVFNACLKLTGDLEIPNVASAGDYAFGGDNASYGTAIKSAKLGSGLQTIPGGLFGGCSSMTSVVFGAGSQVTSIGAKAFINCSSLTEISPTESTPSKSIVTFFSPVSEPLKTALSPLSPTIPSGVRTRPGTESSAQLFAFVQKPLSGPVQVHVCADATSDAPATTANVSVFMTAPSFLLV